MLSARSLLGHAMSREMVARLNIVAAREFFQRRALRARSDGLFCCAGVREGGRPMCIPRALARLRPSAVRMRSAACHALRIAVTVPVA